MNDNKICDNCNHWKEDFPEPGGHGTDPNDHTEVNPEIRTGTCEIKKEPKDSNDYCQDWEQKKV